MIPINCCYLNLGDTEWIPIVDQMKMDRRGPTATIIDNSVIICGGTYADTLKCESFDLVSHTFSSFPDMIDTRSFHCAVLYNNSLVVIGGQSGADGFSAVIGSCERFNRVKQQWELIAPLNNARAWFGAAIIKDEIFVAGGFGVDSVEMFDGTSWLIVSQLPTSRVWSGAVSFGGKFVVLGGDCYEFDVYDPTTMK